MKIAIIGTGNVGSTLGARWAQGGHSVVFGSRHPESGDVRELVTKAGGNARAAGIAEAAAASDVVVLATPWPATREAIGSAGDLSGKVLIDATNPLLPDLSGLDVGTTTSAGEQVAQWAAGAKVVKAFNTVGAPVMGNPHFGSARAVLFYCGDDAAAKQITRQLATELGFDAADAGPLAQARVLEPFAMLWISLAVKQGFGVGFAFQLIRREAE